MLFRRKKIKCTLGPAPNPETMEFFFHGDHRSFSFPDVRKILKKGLTPCQWQDKSEGMVTYEIATDDFHHTLLCDDGEVDIDDNNWGLWVFVRRNNEILFQRVQNVLRESGRFELVQKNNGKV
jgi:hypothetical protein